jgi:predicted metallopeptidase
MRYLNAPDVKKLVDEIIDVLDLNYISPQLVYCFKSKGTKSKNIIARIHGLGKIWQKALNIPPSYIIEVLSEKYDNLEPTEKEKVLIHELLHIPKGFLGGFRHHKGYITRRKIDELHKCFKIRRKKLS